MRRRPDFHDSLFDSGRLRLRHRCGVGWCTCRRRHVPRRRSADVLVGTLRDRCRANTVGFDRLKPGHLYAGGGSRVVDNCGVAADVELWPRKGRVRSLTKLIPTSCSGELDRRDLRRPERIVGGIDCAGAWAARNRCDYAQRHDWNHEYAHKCPREIEESDRQYRHAACRRNNQFW